MLPSSYNDIWLINQLNQLKLSSYSDACDESEDELSTRGGNSAIMMGTSSGCIVDAYADTRVGGEEDLAGGLGFPSSTKLSDIVKSRLLQSSSSEKNFASIHGGGQERLSPPYGFLSEEDTLLIDELVRDVSILSVPVTDLSASSRLEEVGFGNSGIGVCDGEIRNGSSNSSSSVATMDGVSNSTGSFTQEEIDGIKEILSQEC